MTCSARPYIGDESITRPPSFTKARRTSASGPDCAGSTSNVCHVPSPITGNFSLDEGIGRASIPTDSFADAAHAAPAGRSNTTPAEPINLAASRRVIAFMPSSIMSSAVETSLIQLNSEKFLDFAPKDTNFSRHDRYPPSFHQSFGHRGRRAWPGCKMEQFIRREHGETIANSYPRRHRIHRTVSDKICAQPRA